MSELTSLKKSARSLAAGVVVLSSTFVMAFSGTVAAVDGTDSSTTNDNTVQTTDRSGTDSTTNSTETHATKLNEVKLKVCMQREKTVNSILTRAAKRGDHQIAVFNGIAEKTEAFYTKNGKTLSNYDQLLADVNAKKAAAQTAVTAVDSSSVTFKCDGTDPKGAAAAFKDKVKTEIAALKAYKTAVKNLIVGVKSVSGDNSSSEGSQQ